MKDKSIPVIGAICGDIIGSFYEVWTTKDHDFEICWNASRIADDSDVHSCCRLANEGR